jgi:hypothetical protein
MSEPPRPSVRPPASRRAVQSVEEMIAARVLGPATPNLLWLREAIAQCKKDLDLAQFAYDQANLKGALVNAYDAARNAIECHMNANALRVTNPVSSHKTVIDYARGRMSSIVAQADLELLDILRELRHSAEYPLSRDTRVPLKPSDAKAAIDLCLRIAGAVGAEVLGKGKP